MKAKTVKGAVVALRKHLKLSQQVWATQMGLSTSSVQNYESGRLQPEPRALIQLMEAAALADRTDLGAVFAIAYAKKAGLPWERRVYIPPVIGEPLGQLAAETVLFALFVPGKNTAAIVDVIGAAIEDPERAKWFREEAMSRGLIGAPTSKEGSSEKK